MEEEVHETELVWGGINIEVRFTQNWLNGTAHHLELRAGEPLSVTATGYRSHFFHTQEELSLEDVLAFVLAWLEEEAESRAWNEYLERSRQGDLFDL